MAVEVCTAVVSAVASKVAELLFNPIQREICYVFKYKSYVEKLRSQLGDLNNGKQRLEQTVENAKRQGDKIFDDVEQYLMKMNEFIARAEKLVDEEEDKAKNKRCFIGLCPNFMSRHKLSQKAVNAAKDAENLLREGYVKLDKGVSYRPAPERIEITNATRGYQQFDSRMKVFNNVMEALKDSNVDMIGVYGMGGVGKTTLAKQVGKKVVEDNLFDEVVVAEVTQTPDLKRIQYKLARDLGLTFRQPENEFENACQLFQRLKDKRVLVILDNIWAELKLEDVGIPLRNDEKEGKDVQRRCTVLLTSRDHHVLCNDMNSQKNFPIEVLSNEEAMILFWKMVDNHSMKKSNFQLLANGIVEKCGGLPVAITTIASALKNKPLVIWEDALNRLRNSDARHIRGFDANVYSAIKLSYNFLVNDEAKSLFRLCALQKNGSEIPINDLMMYVMSLGCFMNVQTLEQVRNRVLALIDNLKSSCLLLDGDNEHVKMHDIIHAVGVSIAEEEHMFNIQNIGDLKEELENVIPKDPIAISLTCDIQELPQSLECPKLSLFLIFANYRSPLQIQNLFSEEMKDLRVLNLTQIVFPPSLVSFACLINLRTLSLIDCHSLVDVALVGELKKLQILSFRGSDIEQLPLEIGQLTQLKKLDLSNCSRLEVIAPNVISKLSQLEELYMLNSFTQWEKGEGGSNIRLVELNALSQLTTLEINIPDVKIVPPDLVSVELERFKIVLGYVGWINMHNKAETSRTLKFKGLVKNSHLGERMKMLLKRTEDLYLDELNDCHHVTHELDNGEGFPQLKYLSLKNSPEFLYIVNLARQDGCNAFPLLESLQLHNLINLEKICCGQLTEDQSFSNLRIIKVEECHELKHLFSFSMAKNLLRLQEIEVTNCEGLKLIVGEESESYIVCKSEVINFAQLHSLALKGVPQLRCSGFNLEISQRLSATSSSASKEIVAEDDPQDFVTVLFNNKVTFPTLETLILSSLNIEKIWLDQFSTCQNLTKLKVKDCSHLKFLFSYSMVPSLVQLQNLVIEGCKSMEWVINTNGLRKDEEQMIGVMVFPKLKSLALSHLPRLRRFVSMRSWEENECEKVEILFGSSELSSPEIGGQRFMFLIDLHKVTLPSLETLKIAGMSKLRKIWHHQFDSDSFSKLKQLEIRSCDNLMNFFSSNIILGRRFKRLERVRVIECKLIKEIIEEETSSNRMVDEEFAIASTSTGTTSRFSVFPQLTSMELKFLPALQSIYQGVHMFEWPMLKYLWVCNCEKVKILFGSSELLSGGIEIPQPVFLIDHYKVALPSLETLEIARMNKLRKIWHHQFDSDSFSKLKDLKIKKCDNLMNIFSSNIILGRRFQRLERVEVTECKLIKEIIEEATSSNRMVDEEFPRVSTRSDNTGKFSVLPQLTWMELWGLPALQSIYQGVYTFEWPMLKDLLVHDCEKVEILFGSSELLSGGIEILQPVFLIDHRKIVFPNLKNLEVNYCDSLRNLATLSTVDSLVKLAKIEINSCEMIEEIVQHVGEVKVDPIVFSQLVDLELSNLPRLEHFLGGNYTLEFPYLEKMVVNDCLNMKIFSQGVLRTPKLQKVKLRKYEERWEGSLNSTIQKMFEEMAGIYQLTLSQVPRVKEIWHDQIIPVSFFDNLRILKVDDCKLMLSAIPANILRFLKKLSILKVKNCDSVEEVFHMEELNTDEHSLQLFPKLWILCLSDLPKLKRFCNFSRVIIELPSLESLTIENCSNIETFISNSTPDQPFFNEKVTFHDLSVLKLSKLPKLLHLCKENSWVSFQNLIKMEVSKCDGLTNLMALSTAKSLMKLKRMKITNCKMIEEIIHVGEEVKKDCIVFRKLEYLELSCLPSLTGFFLGNYTLEFPSLEQVIVKECPMMEIFSRGVLSTPKLERLQLTEIEEEEIVKEDEWLWEDSLNSTIQKLFEEKNVQSSKDEH